MSECPSKSVERDFAALGFDSPEPWFELREVTPEGLYYPHNNPREYEYAFDFAWATETEARAWIENWIRDADDDPDEVTARREEAATWVVVKMSMEVIG